MKELMSICEELKVSIAQAYDRGITIPEAEKLAFRTLEARLLIADELRVADLNTRMRKNGSKAVRSKAYLTEINAHDKKPTETYLENVVNLSQDVVKEESELSSAEAYRDWLKTYLDIFADAHIFARQMLKGSFE